MNAWDMYANRIGVRGGSKRESIKNIEIRNIYTNLPDSLSYYDDVTIDGVQQTVAIINSDNLDEKTMISMPGENIKHGGLVRWMDQYWLVIEKDYNNTLYVRTKLQQCNYLLRWVSEDAVIHEQWCIVEDGTKLEIVSAYRNVCVKRPIELLEVPKAIYTTTKCRIGIIVNVAKAEKNK